MIKPSTALLVALLLSASLQASKAALAPCLDQYAARLGVTALPSSASTEYKNNFCQYTFISTDQGRIEIFGGTNLSSLQLYRARKILLFYLENIDCSSCYGANKNAVRNKMGQNRAKVDMPNGAHQQAGAGTALQGQELYQMETPVEGDSWFMNNNMDHRDAAFEELLHLVHDMGIGVDGSSIAGALPAYQNEIKAAMNNAKPTWLGGTGLWGENEQAWINELQQENSLTQEYLASVIDVYYGLWGAYGQGMWGIYKPATRAQMQNQDPKGYALVPKFFSPVLTWMVMLHPSLTSTFSMTFDSSKPYTHKSQYYLHATLLGTNNANIIGNSGDNCMGPNAGSNSLDGRSGTDVVLFQGNCNEYTLSCNSANVCTVQDSKSNRDGVTTTTSVEYLAFRDGDYNIASGSCTTVVSSASTRCWKLLDIPTPVGSPTTSPSTPAPATSAPTPPPQTQAPSPSPGGATKYYIEVKYDNYPREFGWFVTDMTDRSALQQLIKYPTLSYGTKLGTVVEELPLAPGRTYVLSMRDIYGDGSCCSNGVGYARVYSVTNGVQSEILYRDGTFEYKLNWMFKVPEAAA